MKRLVGYAMALVSLSACGVTPLDPSTFAGVAMILVAAAGGAVYLPARRATRIGAAEALRGVE